MWPPYSWVRRALFSMDAERAHELTLAGVRRAPAWLGQRLGEDPHPSLARDVGGVRVRSPVGLAAGLDKDGVAVPFWSALGFGFVEVGTVTMHPQPGNPRPRLFRLVEDRAIINRMGFNNHGSDALAATLRAHRDAGRWPSSPVGANLGKSKVTSLEDAPLDYATSARRLAGLVDWFTVNVSSPNTPGLRELQDRDALLKLLPAVVDAAAGTPVWLKLAPDLGDDALSAAVELAKSAGVRAVVATNTTLRRDGLQVDPKESGGLSGRPLHAFAVDRIRVVIEAAAGGIDVIGVGGIERGEQVEALLGMGCAAVQLYTAFIYEGPELVARLNRSLLEGG